jgi:oligoribonuclease NrnB/cAMP/cGMP phosphodiesterase (DHH superfamily)
MKDTVVLYHANCPDGFGAAWAAWKKFKDAADYIPVRPRTLPTEALKGKDIYCVDVSYPEKDMKKLIKDNACVTVIDHHASAEDDVKHAIHYSFDLNHSGCTLAWRFFHPGAKLPKMLAHVEDMDLWKFKVPHTEEAIAYIGTLASDFAVWDKAMRQFEDKEGYKEITAAGKLLLTYERALIGQALEQAVPVTFGRHKTYAVNSPLFNSKIGHALYTLCPPIGIIWHEDEKGIKVSLRSDGSVDVSFLAAQYGGGGHKASAGFFLPAGSSLPWKRRKS